MDEQIVHRFDVLGKKAHVHDSFMVSKFEDGGRDRRRNVRRANYRAWFCLSSLGSDKAVNKTASVPLFAGSERLPPVALPISAAGVLSPSVVSAVVPLPVVRMNLHVRIWRIVIPLHRMPAGRAGLIAHDGRRRAVALNRYRRCASRRPRRRCLSGHRRCRCERRYSRGRHCGNQEAFHRKLLWLDPPDPLDHAAPTLGFEPLFRSAWSIVRRCLIKLANRRFRSCRREPPVRCGVLAGDMETQRRRLRAERSATAEHRPMTGA